MKKRLFALLTLGVLAIGGILLGSAKSYSPVMAEEPQSSEPAPAAFEEKVYTYSDENGVMRLTLMSETEFKLEAQETGKDLISNTGTYTREGAVLILKIGENELKIVLDEINMTFGDYVETYECKVVLSSYDHGEVTVDMKEGHVGDIVTVNANADILYLVSHIDVNGVELIEDEDIKGLYKFALVEGENKITVKFAVDKELLGELSTIYEQAVNKDWTHLFSVENVVTIIMWLINGGALIVLARYCIKDKKTARTVEKSIKETAAKVLPEMTKGMLEKIIRDFISPFFSQIQAGILDIEQALTVFCRCFALAQEGTPEARIAITKELSSLKISDNALLETIKEKIESFVKEATEKAAATLANLAKIEEQNNRIIEEPSSVETPAEEPKDNGTQFE